MAKKKTKKALRQLKLHLHAGFLEDYLPELTGAEYKVYSAIALHANWWTGRASPTFDRIRTLTGITDHRSIKRAVDGLVKKGVIEVQYRRAVTRDDKEYGRKRFFYRLKYPSKKDYINQH